MKKELINSELINTNRLCKSDIMKVHRLINKLKKYFDQGNDSTKIQINK
jgi:hypothetical protein